jgi:outer membrane murein-binding lipoprotein Lpp
LPVKKVGGAMNKKLLIILLALCGVLLSGCKKDDQVKSVMKDLDTFTNDLVKKVEAAADPAIGLDEAQKLMDAKKGDIKSKLDTLKSVRGFQINEDTKKAMLDGVTKNVTSVASLQIKYVSRSIKDAAFKSKLEKFINDYTSLMKS